MTPLVTEGMLGSLLHLDGRERVAQLTTRQREVLQLLAEGKSMKEVASVLNVTPGPSRFTDTGSWSAEIKTNAELIQFAIRQHLV